MSEPAGQDQDRGLVTVSVEGPGHVSERTVEDIGPGQEIATERVTIAARATAKSEIATDPTKIIANVIIGIATMAVLRWLSSYWSLFGFWLS